MRTTLWTPTLAWLAAASGAFMLAVAAPSESILMGQLPSLTAQRLDLELLDQPSSLRAPRTLALVGFSRDQREEIQSWIRGLQLDRDHSIPWVKMPVLTDPGSEAARRDAERQLLATHRLAGHSWRLVPVFANRAQFIRAAGLSGMDHASVLVLSRDGRVLARAEGPFDERRAQALRETLLAQRD